MKKKISNEIPREISRETEEKIIFYDELLKLSIPFVIIIITLILFFEDIVKVDILFFPLIILEFCSIIPVIIFTFGMIYHMYKSKYWFWMALTLATVLIGIGPTIITICFYFIDMRKDFKIGKGIYKDIYE